MALEQPSLKAVEQWQARHTWLPPALRRRILFYIEATRLNMSIDPPWMVKVGLAETIASAKVMLFRDSKSGVLAKFRKGEFIYELKPISDKRKEIAKERERRKVVMRTYAVANAKAGRQPPIHWSLQNVPADIKRLIPKDVLCKVRDSDEHSLQLAEQDSPLCTCEIATDSLCGYCSSLAASAPASSVTSPRRWLYKYGFFGTAWAGSDGAAFDALDILHAADAALPQVHRLYFTFFAGWDSVGTCEFDSQPHKNRCIRRDIVVRFNDMPVRVHYERYPLGSVYLKANLTDSPIPYLQVPDFKRALHKALGIDAPAPEDWKTVSCDVNFDMPTAERKRRSFTGTYKNTVIHAYNKRVGKKRVLRLEAQLDGMETKNDTEFFGRVQRAAVILLESVGKRYDHNILL